MAGSIHLFLAPAASGAAGCTIQNNSKKFQKSTFSLFIPAFPTSFLSVRARNLPDLNLVESRPVSSAFAWPYLVRIGIETAARRNTMHGNQIALRHTRQEPFGTNTSLVLRPYGME
jgi:hypothetical protein